MCSQLPPPYGTWLQVCNSQPKRSQKSPVLNANVLSGASQNAGVGGVCSAGYSQGRLGYKVSQALAVLLGGFL